MVTRKRARRSLESTSSPGARTSSALPVCLGSGKSTLVAKLTGTIAGQGRQGGRGCGRPVQPLFGRRDPRRSHSHERDGLRSRRLYPLHGDAWRVRRPGARGARRRRHSRCRGFRNGHRRDRRRRPGRGRDRQSLAHDHCRLGPRPRRRGPGDQGRHFGDRRHSRRVQMRSQRRQSDDRRSQADAHAGAGAGKDAVDRFR